MKISEDLEKALDVLIKNGWTKNTEEDKDGKHCMIGAIRFVVKDGVRTNELCDFLAYSVDPDFEPKHEFGFEIIGPWNDLMATDFKDVKAAFKDAIKRAKALKL